MYEENRIKTTGIYRLQDVVTARMYSIYTVFQPFSQLFGKFG